MDTGVGGSLALQQGLGCPCLRPCARIRCVPPGRWGPPSAVGTPTGSPAPPVHRHTSHHTHHPLSARLPPPHKLRRLPPTSARQTRRSRKKEKTSAPPSEGTPPIQEEGAAGVEEEEDEEEEEEGEEEEGESEAEPVEPPPSASPKKAKVGGCPWRRAGCWGRGVERWGGHSQRAWARLGGEWGLSPGRDPGHVLLAHSSPLEAMRMTVPACPGGLPSPGPCPRWALMPRGAPSSRPGTGAQPSPEQVLCSFLILRSDLTCDPREERTSGEGQRKGMGAPLLCSRD